MEFQEFCVGICPHCDGNGLLLVVKDDTTQELRICCDECYQEYRSIKDLKMNISHVSHDLNNVSVSLEEAVSKGWAEYIYVLDKGKWVKYTDRTVSLF